MATREFLHGGYRAHDGAVIVLSGGTVAGVWFPGTMAITTAPPQLFAPTPEPDPKLAVHELADRAERKFADSIATVHAEPDPMATRAWGPRDEAPSAVPFRPAPKPSSAPKKGRPRR